MDEIQPSLYNIVFGFPRNPKWSKLAKEFLIKNPVCWGCGVARDVQVHHVKPYHLFPELEMEWDNLVPLCVYSYHFCHFRLGHLLNWSSYNENVREDCKIWYDKIKNRPTN